MSRQTCDTTNCNEPAVAFAEFSFGSFFYCEKHAPADVAVTR